MRSSHPRSLFLLAVVGSGLISTGALARGSSALHRRAGATGAQTERTAGATTPAAGHCQLTLRVTVRPARSRHTSSIGYRSTSGSAACIGTLGPWLMGGKTGWSTSRGTLSKSIRGAGTGQRSCLPSTADGNVFAEAPRYAWIDPPMVTFSAAFRIHRLNDVLAVTGRGQLLPTRESPIAASVAIGGTATLVPDREQSCNAGRWTGTLTLRLAVRNRPAT